jgi:hypothetical protein
MKIGTYILIFILLAQPLLADIISAPPPEQKQDTNAKLTAAQFNTKLSLEQDMIYFSRDQARVQVAGGIGETYEIITGAVFLAVFIGGVLYVLIT